jgi:hypothetical protein
LAGELPADILRFGHRGRQCGERREHSPLAGLLLAGVA